MTKTIALVLVVWLCVACCARRVREESNAEFETPNTTKPQMAAGNPMKPSSKETWVTQSKQNLPIESAEKNLRRARKVAQSNLVSARNNYAMEVLHNRSMLLRAILKKQKAEEPTADC